MTDGVAPIPLRRGAGARLLGPLLRSQWRRLTVVVVIIAVSAVATAAIPVLVERAVDAADRRDRAALLSATGWFTAVTVVGALVNGARLWLITVVGQDALHGVRTRATRSLGSLPIADFERIRRGDVVARVTSDVDRLESAASEGVPFVVSAAVTLVAATVGLVIVSPTLALIALIVVPPMVGAARWLVRHSRGVYPRARRVNGEMIAELAETVEGADEIRAFGRAGDRRRRFRETNRLAAEASLDGMRMRMRFYAMTTMSQSTVTAVVVVVAATMALEGSVSAGVVAAAVVGVTRVFEPLADLVQYIDQIQSTRAALDRVAAVVELGRDVPEAPGGWSRGACDADVNLDDVSFEYVSGRPVLHDLTLHLAAGSTTAIIGDTGAGKSTIARLITGLAAPTAGTVRIGGAEIAPLSPIDRRRLVVTVLQEGFCIDGTIADNVRLADPAASDDAVVDALRRSGGDWWRRLPDGHATQVGTGGHSLSDGERQLLALARVVLLDPRVVVLDEATSLLDPDTEAEVAAALERTFADRTVVIIAHRRATAARCSRVVHLASGRIIADGPPATVLASDHPVTG
jgi:ATP-binding cassette, subfamily B, bacterial